MLAFGNDELVEYPPLHAGEAILCPHCGESHIAEAGKDATTGEEFKLLLFYRCGETSYLCGVDGRNVMSVFMRKETR